MEVWCELSAEVQHKSADEVKTFYKSIKNENLCNSKSSIVDVMARGVALAPMSNDVVMSPASKLAWANPAKTQRSMEKPQAPCQIWQDGCPILKIIMVLRRGVVVSTRREQNGVT